MPLIKLTRSIAGATTVENLLAGNPYEFLPAPMALEMALTTDAAATVGDLVATVHSGADLLADEFPLDNAGPINVNEDLIFQDVAAAGDRLQIRVRNTTAATARNVNLLIRLSPL